MSRREAETPVERTVRLLRQQAEGCGRMGSPLYDVLLRAAADDLLADGPTARVLDGHLEDPGPSALALRMLGGVHALALSGRAPGLARFYSSVAGPRTPPPRDAVPDFLAVLEEHREEIRDWLQRPPQTNEVGRGAALIGGLLHAAAESALPIRLVEVGASGGLNLRADRFHISGEVGRYGDPSSPVNLGAAWQGVTLPTGPLEVVERYGGDVDPIDVSTEAGRLLLTAYVWPDQLERIERLRGAFDLAATLPVTVQRETAEQTLGRTTLTDDTWTVVWHSVFQQYLTKEDRERFDDAIARLGESAEPHRRFAHLKLEPERRAHGSDFEFLITLRTWPGGEARILGTAPGHGVPTTWEHPLK